MSTESVSVRLSRSWTRLYTRGLPVEARERRVGELESDLWEQLHDPDCDPRRAHREVLGRTLRGIHADVWWRYRTLLDQRGARQRSHDMTTTRTSNWWPPVTLALSLIVGIVGLLGLMVGEAVTGGEGRPFVLVAFPVLGSMLMLGGLVARRSRPVGGSRLVVAGATLAVLGDLFLIPVPVVVILGGIWSGNLVLTDRADRPELRAVQGSIADRWPWWILAAAVFTALGFAALVVGDLIESESCTESSPCWEGTAVWATWILSWLAAMVTGAIGLVLGVLRAATRHHTRLA